MKSTTRSAVGRSATAVALFVFGFVLTQPGPAEAVATITAPHRIYGLSNNNEIPVIFTGTDPLTMESNVISVVAPIGTGSNTDCTPTIEENWAASGCSAVTLTVNGGHGKLRLPGNVFTDNADPLKAVVKSAGGAIVDTSLDDEGGDSFIFHFYGTQAQLNDTLAVLQWIPDKTNESDMDAAPYEYTGNNGETLQIMAVPGDNSGNADPWTVQIRMEGINAWPDLTVPSGPFDVIAGTADGYVSMTGDNLGDFDPPPDFFVTDEDVEQGETGDKILVAMVATCGEFHLLGSQLGFSDEINDILVNELSLPQMAADAILAILPDEISGATFGTGDPSDWHTAYAAAGDLEDVQYTLSQVTFRDTTDDETCELFTFVTDLGNNGLPLQYIYLTPPADFEIPFPGFDFGITTFKVGAGTEINVSLPPTLTINEAASGNAAISVTPAEHPAFDVTVSTANVSATGGADYTTVTNLTVPIPENANPTDVVLATLADFDIEGPETFTLTLAPPATPPAGYTITAGNATTTVTIIDDDNDVTSPTVTINQAGGQADPTSTSPILFTATFDEPVTGFVGTDISFTGSTAGGTLTATVTGGPAIYTVSVDQMTTSGTVIASIPAATAIDSSLNPNTASTSTDNTVSWVQPANDVTSPTVTINQAGGQADPTSTSPILFTATFDEPVTGFVGTDISFTGSTAGGTLTATVTGGPAIYTVSVDQMTTSGTVIATIPAATAIDSSLNPNTASTSTDNTVTWVQPANDVTSPTVTINQAGGQADPTSTAPILFTATFDEPVTGFVGTDISFTGSTAGGTLTATVTGGPAIYTVSVDQMTTSGTVIASIPAATAIDSSLNPNTASTSTDNTVTWVQPANDVTSPTVTINQAGGQADPTSTAPILFTATFDEPVTGFVGTDISFTGSTAGGTLTATVTGGPAIYTVSVDQMTTSGTVTASIPAATAVDSSLNPNTASTSTDNTVSWVQPANDVTSPTVTINQAGGQADPTSTSPILFTATFDEPVTGFVGTDISFTGSTAGGTLTATVTGGPAIYTVSVDQMTTSGTVTATIPAATAVDSSLNPNTASTSTDNTVSWVQPPPLTLTVPANIVRPNDPGQAGAIVAYPAVTAAGGIPPITITCNRQSATFFPLGTTNVTCTAADQGGSVSGSFTITVIDTEPPVIADNPDLTTATTGSLTPVTFALPAASDNSGVAPAVACSPASGSGFAIGSSVVTCTATDGAGNKAMSDFTVTITSSGQLPPTEPGASEPPPAPASGTGTSGPLPVTGTDTNAWLVIGWLLVTVGAVIRIATHRRTARR